ncbi:type III restriction endonuclease subunit R [Muribaculaceae bacterium Isolate-104 (HZI)]|nr:type III restriction endonuclease subunit R [Muribaculaceae bacterium Isolate-104 (HZI)]
MKTLKYQQDAINELTDKAVKLLNLGGARRKIVFEAPTGAGKTVMTCQTLANIVDELRTRGDSRFKECAFIWFAPRKLHLQSYMSHKGAFGETRKLTPVMFDELDQSEGIQPGEILFVNWESVNKEKNIMVRDSESSASLYEITRRTQQELGLPIVAVIDEEHMFWSNTADKTEAVLERISPAVELRISATPKTAHPDERTKVYRQDVIKAEMIKKEVVLNPEIEVSSSEDDTALNERLIKIALEKRNQIAEAYRAEGVSINPLLLIQLPNDKKEAMTVEDEKVAAQVKTYLKHMCDITEENGKLAVWLSNEKSNLAGLEKPDNLAQVLLFKEAIALGWDCPRAAVLLIFRKLQSDRFTIQTVGRILRMPQQKHYPNDLLNVGYVYTDIAKEKIDIVTADAGYILNDTITAHRRANLCNVSLKSVYSERPNIERNYLGTDFRNVLYDTATDFWKLEQGAGLFSIAELAAMRGDEDEYQPLPETDDLTINENRRRVQNSIRLDVKTINIEIPKDVHFQNEVQTLSVERAKFARTAGEIDGVFIAYIDGKGGQFERKGRTDKIASFLTELIADSFGIYETDAKKVVLYHENRPKFDRLLETALEKYARKREVAAAKAAAARVYKEHDWEVPEQRVYYAETNRVAPAENHALLPFIQLNTASNPEKEFVKFLEANSQWIDWWYKNGDNGKANYAIEYHKGQDGEKGLFYVDFVIRMKNGHIYLFDTKSAGSDIFAADKHNALLEYVKENSTAEQPLAGGVILQQGSNWLYSPQHIDNTTDTLNWSCFYPQQA